MIAVIFQRTRPQARLSLLRLFGTTSAVVARSQLGTIMAAFKISPKIDAGQRPILSGLNCDSFHQANNMAFVRGDFPLTRPVHGLSGARSYPHEIIKTALGNVIAQHSWSGARQEEHAFACS
jgi:hypothetical protein